MAFPFEEPRDKQKDQNGQCEHDEGDAGCLGRPVGPHFLIQIPGQCRKPVIAEQRDHAELAVQVTVGLPIVLKGQLP